MPFPPESAGRRFWSMRLRAVDSFQQEVPVSNVNGVVSILSHAMLTGRSSSLLTPLKAWVVRAFVKNGLRGALGRLEELF
jgi:hypothetical protein